MSIQEIETEIAKLPPNEVAELTAWLTDYHHKLWDRQLESDLDSGRLDVLIDAADREYEQGLARPL
jgi:hypothetical protein